MLNYRHRTEKAAAVTASIRFATERVHVCVLLEQTVHAPLLLSTAMRRYVCDAKLRRHLFGLCTNAEPTKTYQIRIETNTPNSGIKQELRLASIRLFTWSSSGVELNAVGG
jgi:hypothetical protein